MRRPGSAPGRSPRFPRSRSARKRAVRRDEAARSIDRTREILCVHSEFVPPQTKEDDKPVAPEQTLPPVPYFKLVSRHDSASPRDGAGPFVSDRPAAARSPRIDRGLFLFRDRSDRRPLITGRVDINSSRQISRKSGSAATKSSGNMFLKFSTSSRQIAEASRGIPGRAGACRRNN